MITWQDVSTLDPNLVAIAPETGAAILVDVYQLLSPTRWGSKLDLAAKYLAAHTASLVLRGGGLSGTTPLTMQQLGPAQQQFAQPTVIDEGTDLDATPWGKRYKMLVRGLGLFSNS